MMEERKRKRQRITRVCYAKGRRERERVEEVEFRSLKDLSSSLLKRHGIRSSAGVCISAYLRTRRCALECAHFCKHGAESGTPEESGMPYTPGTSTRNANLICAHQTSIRFGVNRRGAQRHARRRRRRDNIALTSK